MVNYNVELKIKEYRKKNKIKTKELAELLNVSEQAYYKYENNTYEPNIINLWKLADYFNTSIDSLVGREYGTDIGYLTNEQRNIIYIIKKLNEKNLSELLGTALKLLNQQ